MGQPGSGYWSSTRHPWPCLLFLVPLLLAYESGLVWLGGTHPESLRNGADTWLRWTLEAFGLRHLYWSPALLGCGFFFWSFFRRQDRPEDNVGVCTGMLLESAGFAVGLWFLSRNLGHWLQGVGITLAEAQPRSEMLARAITFLGAGIYEEVLFRLVLFTVALWFLKQMGAPALLTLGIAAGGSALLFAAAHHVGPYGESYTHRAFFFRSIAGLYFTLIYRLRGFGIAAGAHAGYDLLAGLIHG